MLSYVLSTLHSSYVCAVCVGDKQSILNTQEHQLKQKAKVLQWKQEKTKKEQECLVSDDLVLRV